MACFVVSINDFRDLQWYASFKGKVNKRLKTIANAVDIKNDLNMHLAGHTFATIVTLSNRVLIESVSRMLGHACLKQTQYFAKGISLKLKK